MNLKFFVAYAVRDSKNRVGYALLGITQPKLLECLIRLERDIEIVIKAAPRSRAEGHVSVVFA